MFDTVHYTCPNCGGETSSQTKAGDCTLANYDMYSIPEEIAISFRKYGVPYPCEHCHAIPVFELPKVPRGYFVKGY